MGHTLDEPSQHTMPADGVELSPVFGLGALTESTLVHAGMRTRVDSVADQAGPPPSSGVLTGLVAAFNTGALALKDTAAASGCAALIARYLQGRLPLGDSAEPPPIGAAI